MRQNMLPLREPQPDQLNHPFTTILITSVIFAAVFAMIVGATNFLPPSTKEMKLEVVTYESGKGDWNYGRDNNVNWYGEITLDGEQKNFTGTGRNTYSGLIPIEFSEFIHANFTVTNENYGEVCIYLYNKGSSHTYNNRIEYSCTDYNQDAAEIHYAEINTASVMETFCCLFPIFFLLIISNLPNK